ncbi:MAG TPA: efflux RND transporter periplasmic adaptor subunit [Anaerolineales bacterium]|nr:efflux RND transporter periplasmic adaptor subunit [Anaerolineales bacterium]
MDTKSVLKGKKTRYWLVGFAIVLIALFALLRINSAGAGNASAGSTATVVSVNVAQTVDASGSLEAQPFADLTWNTGGVVDQVYVKAGDKVKAGDVLMKLRTTSVDASVISAQSDLVTAQKDMDSLLVSSNTDLAQSVIDLKDAQEAYDKAAYYLKYLQRSQKVSQSQTKWFIEETRGGWQYVSKSKVFKGPAPQDWITDAENDLALKKAKLEDLQRTYASLKDGPNAQDVTATQAKIDAAQAKIDSMSIIAPFNGEVLYVESQPRDLVNTDSSALNMADLDHLYIETQIDESDIANIKVGNPVTATLDAVPGLTLSGKVSAIDPLGEVNSNSVQYTVRIDLDRVKDGLSLPLGATANATIQVKPPTTALAVPITVIQNDSKGEYVLVVQGSGSTKRVDVMTGTIVGDRVIVTGDLKEGDHLTTAQKSTGLPRGPFGRGN